MPEVKPNHINIEITDHSLIIDDKKIPSIAKSEDILNCFKDCDCRFQRKRTDRDLIVLDKFGLILLRDNNTDLIFWIIIQFEKPGWRAPTDADPTCIFDGILKAGRLTLSVPVSKDLEHVIRKMEFQDFELNPVRSGENISEICISFRHTENHIRLP